VATSTHGGVSYANGKLLRERGFVLKTPPFYIVALDPAGDGADNNAVVMLGREEHARGDPVDPDFAVEFMLRVKMAMRMSQDLEFSDILAQLYSLHRYLLGLRAKGASSGHLFAVETNGVGFGYEAQLREKVGSERVIGYTTVGTKSDDTEVGKKLTMPRLAGLDNLRVQIESGHLKLEQDAPGSKELEAEFRSFVWRSPGRPEALDGHRDDLVMATAGATWMATKLIPPMLKQASFRDRRRRQSAAASGNMRIH